jgi:D-xylose transport system permease protein
VTGPEDTNRRHRSAGPPPQSAERAPASLAAVVSRYSIQRWRHGELGALPVVFGLVVIAVWFAIQEPAFLSARNISNLIVQIAATGSVAVGIVVVLLLGEIDLSVGSVSGLCSALLGVLIVNHGMPWWFAILVVLATGALIGAVQGAWFALVGVPSFVVTLAGFLAWQGVQLRVLGSTGTVNVFEPHIERIAQSFLPRFWGWAVGLGAAGIYVLTLWTRRVRRRGAGLSGTPIFAGLSRTALIVALAVASVWILGRFNGVPTAGVIFFGLVALFAFVTTRTRFGLYVFAVGGNAEAARRAGVKVSRIRIVVFTLSGVMAAMGGIIFVSRLTAASTQTGGGTFLLEAIAAAVIGGTSLFGGRGSAWSALLGSLVIGSVSNGLDLMAQPPEIKYMVEGAILLAAVSIDALARRSRAAAGR